MSDPVHTETTASLLLTVCCLGIQNEDCRGRWALLPVISIGDGAANMYSMLQRYWLTHLLMPLAQVIWQQFQAFAPVLQHLFGDELEHRVMVAVDTSISDVIQLCSGLFLLSLIAYCTCMQLSSKVSGLA